MREAPEYITASELAEAVGRPARLIRREFRGNPVRGAIKRGGRRPDKNSFPRPVKQPLKAV